MTNIFKGIAKILGEGNQSARAQKEGRMPKNMGKNQCKAF
jgi:hypothetical protein